MRLIGAFLTLCLALAVIKAATALVAIVVLGAIVVALVTRPGETLGCITSFVFLGLLGNYPVPTLLLITALVVFTAIEKRQSQS